MHYLVSVQHLQILCMFRQFLISLVDDMETCEGAAPLSKDLVDPTKLLGNPGCKSFLTGGAVLKNYGWSERYGHCTHLEDYVQLACHCLQECTPLPSGLVSVWFPLHLTSLPLSISWPSAEKLYQTPSLELSVGRVIEGSGIALVLAPLLLSVSFLSRHTPCRCSGVYCLDLHLCVVGTAFC